MLTLSFSPHFPPHPLPINNCRDYSSFLPVQTQCMQFRIATDPSKELDPSLSSPFPSSSLSLFEAISTPANKGAVLFTGGPVWAMDWLPRPPAHHQYLALSAYRELDEVSISFPAFYILFLLLSYSRHLIPSPCSHSLSSPYTFSALLSANFPPYAKLVSFLSPRHIHLRPAYLVRVPSSCGI